MIKRCIIKETEVFEVKCDSLIEFNTEDIDKFTLIARQISKETGVPKNLIYTAPYFFFIDHWHKIDEEWYFYKSSGYDFYFINELLGEIISEYFGLETVHYKVAKLCVNGKNDEYGVISKNFCDNKCVYKTVWDYKFLPRGDLHILEDIRNICNLEDEYLLLLDDLKKFFIRDFYASQGDRTGNNFLFKNTINGIRLAPLYDYEKSFESLKSHIYSNQIALLNIKNKGTQRLLKNDIRFQELLHKVMQADISSFINELEEKHKIIVSTDRKEYYKKHENKIKSLILNNKIVK